MKVFKSSNKFMFVPKITIKFHFSDMLSLGSSEPWPDALEKITGSRKMDAGPLLEFFEPLTEHLRRINEKNGDTVGWNVHSFFE